MSLPVPSPSVVSADRRGPVHLYQSHSDAGPPGEDAAAGRITGD
ncbi:hypothetical protein [Corynebacterium sp.]|nr:hypothetical protein [Corynebacterium sp.]